MIHTYRIAISQLFIHFRGVARILLKRVLNLVSLTKPFLQLVRCIVHVIGNLTVDAVSAYMQSYTVACNCWYAQFRSSRLAT